MTIRSESYGICRTRSGADAGARSTARFSLRFHSKTTDGDPGIMTTPALTTVLRCCACIPLLLCSSIGSHCQKVSDSETRLASCRKQIDETDQQIVALLNQRARIVAEVGKIKQEAHLPVAAPAREQQVLDHIVQLGGAGPLPPDRLRRIYQTVIEEMRTWEQGLSAESEGKPAK